MLTPVTIVTQVVVHVTSALSLWANGCVVTSLVRYSQLRQSNDNLYLGSLAAANFIFSLFAESVHTVYDFRLVTNYTLCRLLSATFLCVQQTAVWILLVATINCYLAIRFPFQYGSKYTKGVVAGSLGLAVCLSSIQTAIVFTVGDMYPVWSSLGDQAFCIMRFVEDFMLHYYVFFMFGKLLPFSLMCTVYIYLFFVVRRMSLQVGPESGGNSSAAKISSKSKEAAQRFGLIVLVYVLCVFPVEVMSALQVWPGWYCGISCKRLVAMMRQVKPLADSILFTYKNRALKTAAIATARCRYADSHELISDAATSTTKE